MPRWRPSEVRALIGAGLAASAEYARKAVSALPDGDYEAEKRWLFEEAGETLDLRLKLKLKIDGERILVDLSEMPPQVSLPINSGAALSAVRVAFKLVIGGDSPLDDGFFSPLELDIPPGTIMSAGPNAPLCHWIMVTPHVIELFIQSIGAQHPELVPASHFCSTGGLLLWGRTERRHALVAGRRGDRRPRSRQGFRRLRAREESHHG